MSKRISVDNIIFLSNKLNIRAGGPCGYIANLKQGLENNNINNVVIISDERTEQQKKQKKKIAKLLTFFIPIKRSRHWAKTKVLSWLGYTKDDILNTSDELDRYYVSRLNKYNFKTITCHTVRDVIKIKRYINERKINAKIIQMEHSPTLGSRELYDKLCADGVENISQIMAPWYAIEKRAFEASDILLAPSRESLDCHFKDAEWFADMFKNKRVEYLPTGCQALSVHQDKKSIRSKFGIKTKYVISFIGRHIAIKGYDILQEIAKQILAINPDVTFLIGGSQSNTIPCLLHDRWIEAGIVNPSEVLSISDAFILPNRETYFDLVLLEVMSMGVPVFASETGGNKSVYDATDAIVLYKNEQDCVEKLSEFLSMNTRERKQISEKTITAYKNNYTLDIFAVGYSKLIAKVTQ